MNYLRFGMLALDIITLATRYLRTVVKVLTWLGAELAFWLEEYAIQGIIRSQPLIDSHRHRYRKGAGKHVHKGCAHPGRGGNAGGTHPPAPPLPPLLTDD
ncbi:MAG: hypothetical protein M0R06_21305 [Sphaerochaeta sp.]|jgi:hypothetical protein|nr:hypothetical protein [Sphaerochaeta sp.]